MLRATSLLFTGGILAKSTALFNSVGQPHLWKKQGPLGSFLTMLYWKLLETRNEYSNADTKSQPVE